MTGGSVQRAFTATPMVAPLRDVDIRLSAAPLPFAVREAAAIAARWDAAVVANPKLYDGPILLFSDVTIEDGRLRATAHRTGFSALLHLIEANDAEERAKNVFGSAAILSSGGACLLGRMGAHTAYPGTVKCPGGTPDLNDVDADGRVDLYGSIVRELAEETGLDAAEAVRDEAFVAVVDGPLVGVHALLSFPEPAAALAARIDAFIARDADPELAGVVATAPDDPLDGLPIPGYTRAFLAALAGRRL